MSERVRIHHFEAEDVHRAVVAYADVDLHRDLRGLLEELVEATREDDSFPNIDSTLASIAELTPLQSPVRITQAEDLVNAIGEIYERALARTSIKVTA